MTRTLDRHVAVLLAMTEAFYILHVLDQGKIFFSFIDDSEGFLVSLLPDIEDMISSYDEVACFTVDFFDEWTRGIVPSHRFFSEFREITRTCPMCRYDDDTRFWDSIEIGLENYSLPFEHFYHKSIVNDLVIHIDRLSRMERDDLHEHTDSAVNSGTVSSRECSENRKHSLR